MSETDFLTESVRGFLNHEERVYKIKNYEVKTSKDLKEIIDLTFIDDVMVAKRMGNWTRSPYPHEKRIIKKYGDDKGIAIIDYQRKKKYPNISEKTNIMLSVRHGLEKGYIQEVG